MYLELWVLLAYLSYLFFPVLWKVQFLPVPKCSPLLYGSVNFSLSPLLCKLILLSERYII